MYLGDFLLVFRVGVELEVRYEVDGDRGVLQLGEGLPVNHDPHEYRVFFRLLNLQQPETNQFVNLGKNLGKTSWQESW